MQKLHRVLDIKATKRRGKRTLDFLRKSSTSRAKARKHRSKREVSGFDKSRMRRTDEQKLMGASPCSESAPTSSRRSPTNLIMASVFEEQVKAAENKKIQKRFTASGKQPPALNKESEQSVTADEESPMHITCSRPVPKTDKHAYDAMIMHFDGFQNNVQYSTELFVLSALLVVTSAVAITVACIKPVHAGADTSSKSLASTTEEKTVESQDDSINMQFAGSGINVLYPPLSSRRPSPWRLQHTVHSPPRLVDVTMKMTRKKREEVTESSTDQSKSTEQWSELRSDKSFSDQKSFSVSFDEESLEDITEDDRR
ncbi:hypothetical protein TTRE_0000129501 [Trichuris trichiura]|uniref:Uncharacterized protein n=1 Tax=Trichuris trichiura TaxID=36087 RepID=A0A077YY28_TRITR|nr:hypothetical protein TTRE_0000129501 [Trichuris trichiura]